jgi:UDP-N-acetylmuramate: L-alanyl-gamma-D-glutamyl-meso-diaminopimelate ligase
MGPNCARKISDVIYTPDGSRFSLGSDEFEMPLIGEFNVRNAAMAISAARFYGVSLENIRKALKSFKGIARRQELRGEERGIKVIDDFAHHPTAIRETLRGLQQRYAGARIWAVFEPRSNTTRRAVFQNELAEALKLADGVFISQIARLEQIPEKERLDPQAVIKSIADSGRPAFYEPDAAHIIEKLVPLLKTNDVVAIFSNGGFDGIHGKLLEKLKS